ncbi:MAG: hypothetical protein L6R36_008331 [Xanthoria steineri]|nr:MAG: hypothetical protein L6R36_008331 [Xanthoria steineri]
MALMMMWQWSKRQMRKNHPKRERDLFTSLDTVALSHPVPPTFCLTFRRLREGFPRVQDPVETSARQPDLNGHLASTEYMPGEGIPDTGLKLKSTLEVDFKEDGKIHTALPSLKLTKQDINRWVMANRASERIEALGNSDRDNYTGMIFARRCTNMSFSAIQRSLFSGAMGFGTAAMVYGGLHALAWSAHFHSPTEQLLWRMSSVVVMGGVPTFGVIYTLAISLFLEMTVLRLLLLYPLLFLIASAYVLARLYLVVECFIQLSHLPAGVYEVPKWSAYFPHIA